MRCYSSRTTVTSAAMEAAASVSSALAACNGVDSEGVRVVTEAEVSLEDLRELIRWDLDDYLSYRAEAPNLTPPY